MTANEEEVVRIANLILRDMKVVGDVMGASRQGHRVSSSKTITYGYWIT
jgi:hypothetical protein